MPVLTVFLSIIVLSPSAIIQPHHSTPLSTSQEISVLSQTVEFFQVDNSTMEAALRALRQNDFAKILIGFEQVARRQGEKTESVSLALRNATVGQILNELCQQSHEYTYDVVDRTVIHVHPAHAQSDPAGLLDLRISEFSVEGNMLPAAIVTRIGDLAPELASFLQTKKSEYYARRDIVPSSPGAFGHGNMDPEISLHLRNITVREILNSTVLYSVQLRSQRPADSHGYKLPTTSWIYKFVVDPNAPTGLGGTPHWVAF